MKGTETPRNARAARHGRFQAWGGREIRAEAQADAKRACEEPGCQRRLISHASSRSRVNRK